MYLPAKILQLMCIQQLTLKNKKEKRRRNKPQLNANKKV